MSPIGNDITSYLIILVFAVTAHESWRWLGAFIGAQIRETDPIFLWVRYVSTALVSALAMRIILFPSGALAGVDLSQRIIALVLATATFLALKRNLAGGIFSGAFALICLGHWSS